MSLPNTIDSLSRDLSDIGLRPGTTVMVHSSLGKIGWTAGGLGGTVIEKLFVYGTLCPDRPNEHVLDAIGGSWETATVSGTLREEGWGAEMGYPGIDLDEHGREVEGFLFTSENLSSQWASLDAFEGEAYERVVTKVNLKDGSRVNAYIYMLRSS